MVCLAGWDRSSVSGAAKSGLIASTRSEVTALFKKLSRRGRNAKAQILPGARTGGRCHPASFPPADMEDAQIAEATGSAAMKIVLERVALKQGDRTADFVTDAYATVALAYHRAAGRYIADQDMLELGTAAVHLLTIATSYVGAQNGKPQYVQGQSNSGAMGSDF
jgi:hypothetical protein